MRMQGGRSRHHDSERHQMENAIPTMVSSRMRSTATGALMRRAQEPATCGRGVDVLDLFGGLPKKR